MKIPSKSGVLRLLAVVVAVLTFGYANATNRLYIEDFTISGTEPVRVAVMLDNTDEVAGLNFTLVLPQGLTMVGTPERNNERFNPSQNMAYSAKSGKFLVVSGNREPFIGNSGALCYFEVQASQAALEAEKPLTISLTNIALSTGAGQELANEGGKQTDTTVTMVSNIPSPTATLSSASEVYINPEGTQRISVSMENNFDVVGLQVNIVLPAGFTIAGKTLNKGARLSEGSSLALVPHADGFTYGAVLSDWTGQYAVTGNDGELFWFDIVAPAGFEAESAVVTFNAFKCSMPGNIAITGKGCAVTVKNGLPAYNRALGEIAALEKSLQDALTQIATEAPNVKDQFPGTEISESIEALKAAVNEAYANLTLTDNYNTVMAPVATINDAIAKLIADAKTAQAEYEAEVARQAAYTNANAEIANLETALANALNTIATEAPNVKDNFKGEAITKEINDLKEAVNKAYEDKTIAEKYDEVMAPVATINAEIAKLIEDAKAAQAEYEAQVARDVALANANAEIANLEAALQAALTQIATEAPDVKDNFKGKAIVKEINDLKEAVNKAYEDKTIVEKYDELMAPVATINAEIAKLIEDAKAAQADFDAEKARQKAYADANAEITKLETALANALAEIATAAPDVKGNFQGEEIRTQINALKEAVNTAYEDKTIVEKYDELMAPVAGINAAIAKLIEDAKAAQADFDVEKARQKAYADANAEIAKLETALTNALAEIATAAPDVKGNFQGEEIRTQINALKEAVNAAYEDKTIVEKYDEIMAPVTTINDAITKLVEDAKAAQAEFDAEKARQKAYADANAEIAKLEAALTNALAEIATAAPDVKDNFQGEEISTQINALKEAVNTAYEDKTIVEKYDELMASATTINAAITKLVEDAKAAQAEYEEQLRRAANQAAYEADLEIIAGLQDKLDIAVDMIKMVYPDYDIDTPAKPVQDAIDAEADKAAAALAAVEEEGIYSNTVDAAAIEAMIEKLKEDAKTLGIDEILGDEFGEGTRIFTLEGVEVPALQQGKVNIVLYPNGLTKKVFIK